MKVDVFWLILGLLPMFMTGYCVGDSAADRDLDRMRARIVREVSAEVHHQGAMLRSDMESDLRFQGSMTRDEVRWRCR